MEENANPMKFEKLFKVTPEMIDENKHMNNVWAVQWVQAIRSLWNTRIRRSWAMKSVVRLGSLATARSQAYASAALNAFPMARSFLNPRRSGF